MQQTQRSTKNGTSNDKMDYGTAVQPSPWSESDDEFCPINATTVLNNLNQIGFEIFWNISR